MIIAVLEFNAVGKISGTGSGGLNVIYETHKNAMYTGFALIVFLYLFVGDPAARLRVVASDTE